MTIAKANVTEYAVNLETHCSFNSKIFYLIFDYFDLLHLIIILATHMAPHNCIVSLCFRIRRNRSIGQVWTSNYRRLLWHEFVF